MGLNLLAFLPGKRYRAIHKKFMAWAADDRRKLTIITRTYIVKSFVIAAVLGGLLIDPRR